MPPRRYVCGFAPGSPRSTITGRYGISSTSGMCAVADVSRIAMSMPLWNVSITRRDEHAGAERDRLAGLEVDLHRSSCLAELARPRATSRSTS